MFRFLRPPPDATIPFLVLVSFLIWFIFWRVYLYFIPPIFFTLNDAHIHHFAYGIILLSILAFVFLVYPMSHRARIRLAIPLGIALSLAYDEFAMWLLLEDAYTNRLNYDAIIIISLILLNTIYFPHFWARWGHRLNKLLNIIFLGIPIYIYKRIRHKKSTSDT